MEEKMVDENVVQAVPRLEPEPADCIGPHAEVPLTLNSSHQAGTAGEEITMSRLYGDTTDHKESTRQAEQRGGQDLDSEASSLLYEKSKEMKICDENKESESAMYQAGIPLDEHHANRDTTGDISAVITGSTPNQAAGTSPNSNDCMQCQEDTPSVITTEMLNPSYIHNVPQRTTEEGISCENNQARNRETDLLGTETFRALKDNRPSVVMKGMVNPAYGNNVPQGAADQGTSERGCEHVYEDMDNPSTDVNSSQTKARRADRQSSVHNVQQGPSAAGTMNEADISCFRQMFLITLSRLTCVVAITAVIMSVVALTVVVMERTSNSKSQTPVPPSPHWSTSLVTSTLPDENTTKSTMILPSWHSTSMPLNTTMIYRGLDGTESASIALNEGNRACAPGKCRDCAEIYEGGSTISSVYRITLQNNTSVEVYCDMDTDGGGWTVIQRRFDGTVPFNRTWAEYKRGFGNKAGEHWLGNDNIHLLTNQKDYRLRTYWKYSKTQSLEDTCSPGFFKVSDEKNDYRMVIGKDKHNSDCDLQLLSKSGHAFSTVDKDNDGIEKFSCAECHGGGWWYGYCGTMTYFNEQWKCKKKNRHITVKPTSLMLKP